MFKQKKHTGLSFALSLILHVGIVCLIVASVGYLYETGHSKKQAKAEPKPIVQAVTVDQAQVQEQIKDIKARAHAKREAQIKWQQNLKHLANEATQKRELEQHALKKLELQQRAAEKKSKQQLARLNQLQKQAQQRLEALKMQQMQLAEQNQAIQQQLVQTQQSLAKHQTNIAEKKRLLAKLSDEKKQQAILAKQQFLNQISRYKTLILNDVGQQWILPPGANKKLSCQLMISLTPTGVVENVRLLKSSGDPVLDQSAITAVLKASPLPVPQDPVLLKQFKQLKLTVRPEGLIETA